MAEQFQISYWGSSSFTCFSHKQYTCLDWINRDRDKITRLQRQFDILMLMLSSELASLLKSHRDQSQQEAS